MNLQQLEYIVAVDTHRHFVRAAEHCFVTQATLSMMIRKLEDELQVRIFDRSRVPVVPTDVGRELIEQARVILRETGRLEDIVQQHKGMLQGQLRVGIIPTLAPYLLPLFLQDFLESFPQVMLHLIELNTETIIQQLEHQQLDAGILATPLRREALNEQPLFYERFVVYAAPGNQLMRKKYVLPSDIDVHRLWLLEEGHCLRNQALNLCELKRKEAEWHHLNYESGSLETLRKMVTLNQGITILPELAIADLNETERERVRYFREPAPAREISIVTYRHFVKERLIGALRQSILDHLPKGLAAPQRKLVTELS